MNMSVEVQASPKSMNGWVAAGQASELQNSGDYLTVDIGREPLVITLNEQGQLCALSRVCRHRGFDMLEGENASDGDLRGRCGNVKRLRCPYHAWTYSLDGQLLAAPLGKDMCDFDKTSVSLPKFALEVVDGVIFVNLQADAKPLHPQLEAACITAKSLLVNENR